MLSKVPDDESNFFLASYKLLIELAVGTLWAWFAAEDFHGTTANTLQLHQPDNWQQRIKLKPDKGQWTVISVLPKAVTSAAVAQELNTA